MKLVNCLAPVHITTPDGQSRWVPCGHCRACQRAKRLRWANKIEQEMSHHLYNVFFTLDYSDRHVPLLKKVTKDGVDYLVSFDQYRKLIRKYDAINDNICIKLNPQSDFERDYYSARIFYPYCRVEDAQNFIKRLRRYISYNHGRKHNNGEIELQKIKYFMAFEYGPKTFRCHLHGVLFIDSEATMQTFEEVVNKAWPYGHCDYSLVNDKNSCSRYVAKYVVGDSDVPGCYKDSRIRTKYIFSRSSTIGVDFLQQRKVQEIFDSGSCEIGIYNSRKQQIVNVPLPAPIEHRLYPRLPYPYSESGDARISIYELFETLDCPSWPQFRRIVRFSTANDRAPFGFSYGDYSSSGFRRKFIVEFFNSILTLQRKNDNANENWKSKFQDRNLYKIYTISRHFYYNKKLLNISSQYYIKKIDEYYKNRDYHRLKKQCEFESDYKYDSTNLVYLDLDVVRHWVNDVDEKSYIILQSFLPEPDVLPCNFEDLPDFKDLDTIAKDECNKSNRKRCLNDKFDLQRFKTTLRHFGFQNQKI